MMTGEPEANGESAGAWPPGERGNTTGREDNVEDRTGRDRTGRDRNNDESKAIRVFFEFLGRHPDRRGHFIRSVLEAGAPKEAVERALDDEDLFVAAVMGDRAEDVGEPMAAATAGPDHAGM